MLHLFRFKKLVTCFVFSALAAQGVSAAEPASCSTVRFGLMGWTDLIATTTVARTILQDLGYKTTETTAAQQIIFGGMRDKRLDVFMGYWKPSIDELIMPFIQRKELEVNATPNLADAQMSLVVPTWLAEKGLKTFSDLKNFKEELGGKIYGIEPGTPINQLMQAVIDDPRFGLKGFKLVESSEAGMLSVASRLTKKHEAVVFLGWKPHPMNIHFDLTYLTGSFDTLGPEEGKATVWTVTRPGYSAECSNVNTVLSRMEFTSNQEAEMMERILNYEDAMVVARDFVYKNQQIVASWTAGMTDSTGGAVTYPVVK